MEEDQATPDQTASTSSGSANQILSTQPGPGNAAAPSQTATNQTATNNAPAPLTIVQVGLPNTLTPTGRPQQVRNRTGLNIFEGAPSPWLMLPRGVFTVIEMLTFQPNLLSSHDACYRLTENGFAVPDLCRIAGYARNTTYKSWTIHKRMQTAMSIFPTPSGENWTPKRHHKGDRAVKHVGTWNDRHISMEGCVLQCELGHGDDDGNLVDMIPLIDLGIGVVNFPSISAGDGFTLTRCVLFAIANPGLNLMYPRDVPYLTRILGQLHGTLVLRDEHFDKSVLNRWSVKAHTPAADPHVNYTCPPQAKATIQKYLDRVNATGWQPPRSRVSLMVHANPAPNSNLTPQAPADATPSTHGHLPDAAAGMLTTAAHGGSIPIDTSRNGLASHGPASQGPGNVFGYQSLQALAVMNNGSLALGNSAAQRSQNIRQPTGSVQGSSNLVMGSLPSYQNGAQADAVGTQSRKSTPEKRVHSEEDHYPEVLPTWGQSQHGFDLRLPFSGIFHGPGPRKFEAEDTEFAPALKRQRRSTRRAVEEDLDIVPSLNLNFPPMLFANQSPRLSTAMHRSMPTSHEDNGESTNRSQSQVLEQHGGNQTEANADELFIQMVERDNAQFRAELENQAHSYLDISEDDSDDLDGGQALSMNQSEPSRQDPFAYTDPPRKQGRKRSRKDVDHNEESRSMPRNEVNNSFRDLERDMRHDDTQYRNRADEDRHLGD